MKGRTFCCLQLQKEQTAKQGHRGVAPGDGGTARWNCRSWLIMGNGVSLARSISRASWGLGILNNSVDPRKKGPSLGVRSLGSLVLGK